MFGTFWFRCSVSSTVPIFIRFLLKCVQQIFRHRMRCDFPASVIDVSIDVLLCFQRNCAETRSVLYIFRSRFRSVTCKKNHELYTIRRRLSIDSRSSNLCVITIMKTVHNTNHHFAAFSAQTFRL